jgi:hypothetical protein
MFSASLRSNGCNCPYQGIDPKLVHEFVRPLAIETRTEPEYPAARGHCAEAPEDL